MKERVKIGVVGCGAQAQMAHLPAIRRNQHAELSALCDQDPKRLELLGERYGVKRRYQEFEEFIKDSALDGVVIATPNHLHFPMAMAGLEYGKDLLCELPLALNFREASEMVRQARRHRRRLVPGLNHRFRPDVAVIRRFVEAGELGKICYAKTGWLRGRKSWRRGRVPAGGGTFLSLISHILDFALWILAPEIPCSILGSMGPQGPDLGVEESGIGILRFASGLTLSIEVGFSLLRERDFTYFNLFGEKGAALLNPVQIHKELHGHLVEVTPKIESRDFYRRSFQLQMDAFIASILKQEPGSVPPEDGAIIAQVIDGFYESVARSREVRLKGKI